MQFSVFAVLCCKHFIAIMMNVLPLLDNFLYLTSNEKKNWFNLGSFISLTFFFTCPDSLLLSFSLYCWFWIASATYFLWNHHDMTSQSFLSHHHWTLAYLSATYYQTLVLTIRLKHDHQTLAWPPNFGVLHILCILKLYTL